MKKDCRAPNTRQNTQALDAEETSDDNDNNFTQFIQNSQEINNQENSKTASRIRFTVSAEELQQEKPFRILVDTGSTICSITEGLAQQLELEKLACQPNIIRYVNGTTQPTKEKAILNLKFNNEWATKTCTPL